MVSDQFLSSGVTRAPLALFRSGPYRLTSGRSFRLVAGPFLLAGSRPGAPAEELRDIPTLQGEHTVMLVLAYDRRMKTTVYATAAVAGRPQVSHFSGRPSMLPPPWELTAYAESPFTSQPPPKTAPSVRVVKTRSRHSDTGTDRPAVFVWGGRRV